MANGIQTQTAGQIGNVGVGLTTASGDAIIVRGTYFGVVAPAAGDVTDTDGNTWLLDGSVTNGSSQTGVWRVASYSGGGGPTITFGHNFSAWNAYSYRGFMASPVDKTASSTGISTAPATGNTATLTQATEHVTAVFGTTEAGADAVTVPATSGYTNDWHSDTGAGSAEVGAGDHKEVSATTAVSANWTITNTATWSALVVTYLVAPAPTVTNISPNSGATAGGTSVTITGTGFQNNTPGANSVTLKGASATGVSVTNDTTITATSGAGSAGTGDVVVTNNNGTGTLTNGWTYTSGTLPNQPGMNVMMQS